MAEVWECIQSGRRYAAETKRKNCGRVASIGEGDEDEAIIADWMEQGLGFRHTLAMVNQHRIERGKTHIGISSLIFAFRRMNPLISKIRKRTQASVNQTGWAEARLNQTKQYLIMLGDITKEDLLSETKTYPLAPCFDPDLLPKITREQLV